MEQQTTAVKVEDPLNQEMQDDCNEMLALICYRIACNKRFNEVFESALKKYPSKSQQHYLKCYMELCLKYEKAEILFYQSSLASGSGSDSTLTSSS